jgi:hypothetical protein
MLVRISGTQKGTIWKTKIMSLDETLRTRVLVSCGGKRNMQRLLGFGPCPSSGILNNRKHNVSETGSG